MKIGAKNTIVLHKIFESSRSHYRPDWCDGLGEQHRSTRVDIKSSECQNQHVTFPQNLPIDKEKTRPLTGVSRDGEEEEEKEGEDCGRMVMKIGEGWEEKLGF